MSSDRGDIVLGWITQLVIVLSVIGVIGFDAVSIGVANVAVQEDANTAARAGAVDYQQGHDIDHAYLASAAYASEHGEEIDVRQFTVDPKTGIVTLQLRRTAATVIARHLGFLRDLTQVSKIGSGQPAT